MVTSRDRGGDGVILTVSDNGHGVDCNIGDTIFDPFVTTRQQEGGTGLGLSVTYALVREHGGTISFTSAEGRGTTFEVRLPLKPQAGPVRVLVVDDEPALRKLVRTALERRGGFVVEEAGNGVDALLMMGTRRPHAVVLDLCMPDMDGLQVCRALKKDPELSRLKVILSTGFPDDPKLREISALGYRDFHPKPINIKELIALITRVCGVASEE